MQYDILIIGGGASGMISAINAALNNKNIKIAIVERNDRVGKKILLTGNGRCNMTNTNANISFYHGKNPDFILNALGVFGVEKTLDFFTSLGVVPKIEADGKVYPYSLQASSVLDCLRMKLSMLGIEEICNFECAYIKKKNGLFFVKSSDNREFFAKKVILCCGSEAGNKKSNFNSYKLAENFGHKVTKLYPSLVQVKTKDKKCASMKGVKFFGNASVYINGKKIDTKYGEILFTDYGLSGPPLFSLSRTVSNMTDGKNKIEIGLNLMSEKTKDEIYMHLKKRNKNVTLEQFLTGMFNKYIAIRLIKDVTSEKLSSKANVLTDSDLLKLSCLICDWRFETDGTNGLNMAQVCAGGIETEGFDPLTMESKIIEGLYVCGEMLDIDGDCGGYNLQWAWSSGLLAGLNASKNL